MLRFLILLCVFAAISFVSEARAEKRIALVIGNSTYLNTPELKNPKNDAIDVAAALRRLGFEVFEGRDLDKRAMERLIRQFGVKLSGADLAFFFYAGHGVQIGGQNYLVPIDARLASEGDADFEGMALGLVLKQMEREAKTSIILLDACRDNPLSRNLARTMGTRSSLIGQGLAEVKTGVGTLIGFSTQPGNVATDGAARNSPYAEALLRHMEASGKDISGVLISVRNDVLRVTDGKQVPWEHTSLTGQVFLKLDSVQTPAVFVPPPAAVLPPPATVAPNYDKEMEISFWNSVKGSKSPTVLQTYVDRYPNGAFAGLARVMIDELKQGASLPPLGQPPAGARDTPDLARALQTELRRVGCDPGGIDGTWGGNAKGALEQFARLANLSLPPADQPTLAALDAVKGQRGRVCPLVCGVGQIEVNDRCVAKAAPERPAKRKTTEGTPRAPRKEAEKPKGGGMCWDASGGGRSGTSLVPCSDPRAGVRAY